MVKSAARTTLILSKAFVKNLGDATILPDSKKNPGHTGITPGRKRGAEAEAVHGTMSTDSALWEFIDACDKWKRDNNKKFTPSSTVFQIILGLGYSKTNEVYKTCESCGAHFTPRVGETRSGWKRRKYCSRECGNVKDEFGEKVCKNCDYVFYHNGVGSVDQWRKRMFCSQSCANAYNKKKNKPSAEDIALIQERYPLKGTQIPELLNKGYTRGQIKCAARHLGISYIGAHKTGADDSWKDGTHKTCSGCEKIMLPRHEETRSKWAVRKYCSWSCVQKFSNRIQFTEEENDKIRAEYPIVGTKIELPGKKTRQIARQAAKLGIKYNWKNRST